MGSGLERRAVTAADAHAHFSPLLARNPHALEGLAHPVLFSAHGPKEMQELLACRHPFVYKSCGAHPQQPRPDYLESVAQAAKNGSLHAIGEIGFDFWPEYRETAAQQKKLFEEQADLAAACGLPLVIHSRKALHALFAQVRRLKKAPAVLFHSFQGSFLEAQSLLKKGVNAFFSFGTPLLWGAKSQNACLRLLPLGRLLLETDAPWQPMRGEAYTELDKIGDIADYAARARQLELKTLQNQLQQTFKSFLNLGKDAKISLY